VVGPVVGPVAAADDLRAKLRRRPWKERLAHSVTQHLGPDACEAILAGGEGIDSASAPTVRARWAKAVIDRLDASTPADGETRGMIMEACACPYSKARIAGARKLFRQCAGIGDFLHRAIEAGFLPDREAEYRDGVIYVAKHHSHPGAADPGTDGFVMHACHCGWAKGTRDQISATFCLCGAGYYRQFFEQVLGSPVRVDVVKSVLRGDSECVMAIRL